MFCKLFTLTLCSITLCSTSLTASTRERREDIQSWLPRSLNQHIHTIQNRIENESTKPLACGAGTDFGFSFRGITSLQHDLLVEIATMRDATNTPPKALDVAAGLGATSWKMILAGAHVKAVELQENTANAMRFNVAENVKNIPFGDTLKNRYRPMRGNAVTFHPNEQYDISWAGYFLHFLPPSELNQYVQNIYNLTKEGGLTYATVNTPCINRDFVALYAAREAECHPHPGYLMINREVYSSYNLKTKEQKNVDVKIVSAVPILDKDALLPGAFRHGLYPTILTEPNFSTAERRTHEIIVKRNDHSPLHYMKAPFLRSVFENAGFVVEQLYYMTANGPVQPEAMTNEFLMNNPAFLGIKARKPMAPVAH